MIGEFSRATVREAYCPYCLAYPGEQCVGKRGKARESNHKERVEAYSERKGKG